MVWDSLRRGSGKLVHRFERRIGSRPCLCYANCAEPKLAFVFFHGYDGSPYDFLQTVKAFYESLGSRFPCVWILPAAAFRTRSTSDLLQVNQRHRYTLSFPTVPLSPSEDRVEVTETWSTTSPLISSAPALDLAAHRCRVQESIEGITCDEIDPSGGYKWWDIPALTFFTGQTRNIRGLVKALRHNLRTPRNISEVRDDALLLLQEVRNVWEIQSDHIFLGGFSQGAMLASDLLINSPHPFAGGILLSGAAIGRTKPKNVSVQTTDSSLNLGDSIADVSISLIGNTPILREMRAQMPIFLCHGIRDPIIPFPMGRRLKRHLTTLGFAPIRFEAFPGGHDFPAAMGDRLFEWVNAMSPTVRHPPMRSPRRYGTLREDSPSARSITPHSSHTTKWPFANVQLSCVDARKSPNKFWGKIRQGRGARASEPAVVVSAAGLGESPTYGRRQSALAPNADVKYVEDDSASIPTTAGEESPCIGVQPEQNFFHIEGIRWADLSSDTITNLSQILLTLKYLKNCLFVPPKSMPMDSIEEDCATENLICASPVLLQQVSAMVTCDVDSALWNQIIAEDTESDSDVSVSVPVENGLRLPKGCEERRRSSLFREAFGNFLRRRSTPQHVASSRSLILVDAVDRENAIRESIDYAHGSPHLCASVTLGADDTAARQKTFKEGYTAWCDEHGDASPQLNQPLYRNDAKDFVPRVVKKERGKYKRTDSTVSVESTSLTQH